ncbi:hypothetical protein PLICRDRAFT_28799 [Plicaturopsis crispa FD-325 SS-3]|nr:hypothetical protein PLICRDRAFT_28799 [Plicaturopsis crispa FD-325 SS-3]
MFNPITILHFLLEIVQLAIVLSVFDYMFSSHTTSYLTPIRDNHLWPSTLFPPSPVSNLGGLVDVANEQFDAIELALLTSTGGVVDIAFEFQQSSLEVKPLESALRAYHEIVFAAVQHTRQEYLLENSVAGPHGLFCYLACHIPAPCRASSESALLHFFHVTSSSLGSISSLMQPILEAHERAQHFISDIGSTTLMREHPAHGMLVRIEEASRNSSFALQKSMERLAIIQSGLEGLHVETIGQLQSGTRAADILVDTLAAAVKKITTPELLPPVHLFMPALRYFLTRPIPQRPFVSNSHLWTSRSPQGQADPESQERRTERWVQSLTRCVSKVYVRPATTLTPAKLVSKAVNILKKAAKTSAR